jgi:hypothetical protein
MARYTELDPPKLRGTRGKQPEASHRDEPMQLGAWQLWRSLPRSCKLFLIVCVVQAVTSGAFASVQLARVSGDTLPRATIASTGRPGG